MRLSKEAPNPFSEPGKFFGRPKQTATVSGLSRRAVEECDGRSVALARVAAERLQIEDAVQQLSASLILGQEAERKRLAAELHDSINQDLAVIAIDLGRLAQSLPDSSDSLRRQILTVQQRTVEVSNEVRNLSHSLHPSVLDHLDLAEALRTYCARFQDREGISTAFVLRNAGGKYPPKVQLAAYRICQEALCNVRKHSEARSVRVELRGRRDLLILTITDSGRGFVVAEPALSSGLGLVSMSERCRLAGGSLEIQSQLGVGTEIRAYLRCGGGNDE
jgi:signal transduction histidine kinase